MHGDAVEQDFSSESARAAMHESAAARLLAAIRKLTSFPAATLAQDVAVPTLVGVSRSVVSPVPSWP